MATIKSIEEKAKAYDEALERAKHSDGIYPSAKELKEYIFPELVESEDERIRKHLIGVVELYYGNTDEQEKKDCLAWLEKQNLVIEMKTPEESLGVDLDTYNKIVDECVYGEQKPAWSEEDEKIWEEVSNILWEGYKQSCSKFTWDDIRDWVKPKIESFKDKVQPKQEWSEEDKNKLNHIIATLQLVGCRVNNISTNCSYIDWLKSLRPQNSSVTDEELAQAKKDAYNDALDKIEYHSGEPTFDDGWAAAIWYLKKRNTMPLSHWKPSDEQITWLYRAADDASKDSRMKQILNELLYDLKKLMEE